MANYKGRPILPIEVRFHDNKYDINEITGCWEWKRATNNIGYGMFRIKQGLMRTAHRVSYEIHKGMIPNGMVVCHTCDNPKCVNPDHLWVGTQKDNAQDMVAKGRTSRAMLGKKHKLATCNQCGAIKPVNIIARTHNDKCKHKP